MSKSPTVIGLMVCRRFDVDAATGFVSLHGICDSLAYSRFPTPLEPFTVYVHLYGSAAEGTIHLLIQKLETERLIYRYRRWLAFPGAGQFVHLEMPIRRCSFPSPGRYLMELFFDGKFLSHRVIDIEKGERS